MEWCQSNAIFGNLPIVYSEVHETNTLGPGIVFEEYSIKLEVLASTDL